MTCRDCVATVIGSGDVFLPATRYQPETGHPETDHEAYSEAGLSERSRKTAGVSMQIKTP